MNENCDKYEAYFTFASEEDYKKHLIECNACKDEFNLQTKISSLVKEVADEYKKRERKKLNTYKMASCLAILLITFSCLATFTYLNYTQNNNYDNYQETNLLYSIGANIDEYGLIQN
ncbi:MAG: hypothetical protein PHV37_08485 [Candidatus Gastranaerophilales bacterium]|nr:hypothetical protein [Candidatus Gastranaerophilales bacterium]